MDDGRRNRERARGTLAPPFTLHLTLNQTSNTITSPNSRDDLFNCELVREHAPAHTAIQTADAQTILNAASARYSVVLTFTQPFHTELAEHIL